MDGGSARRFRINCELPIHQPNPLAHAGQSQSSPTQNRLSVKSSTAICDRKMKLIECASEDYFEVPHAAMLHRVRHRLL
jgi:hypothetical protein